MMRAQLNMGIYNSLDWQAIIAIGECTGQNTYEIACELPFEISEFEKNMQNYKAEISGNKIIAITKIGE